MSCKNNIKFILPNFMALNINNIMMNIYENKPEITMDNSTIYSFYGTFPGCIWNGGRPDISDVRYSTQDIIKIRDYYNKRGVKVTFTFTNQLLEMEHLNDEYCNQILEIFHNGMNEVLLASPILEEYIRRNYPKYKINLSITIANGKPKCDVQKYNLIVLDKKLNRDFEYLKNIEYKNKIELLCDEVCYNNCEYEKEHYKEISALQIGIAPTHNLFGKCRHTQRVHDCEFLAYRDKHSQYYISPNQVKIYNKMGYKYFKLSGREMFDIKGIESIIEYLIKPKYQMDVRTYIIEQLETEIRNFSKKQY